MSVSDSGASNTPVVSDAQPQAGAIIPDNSATDNAPQAGASDAQDPQTITLEEAKKLRSENHNLRIRLKAVDDAKLSELELAKQAAQEAQERATVIQQRLVKHEVAEAARKLGVVNPALVHKLIAEEIQLDDDGNPHNAEALIRALVKDNPYLVQQQPVGGSVTNPSRGGNDALPIFTQAQVADLAFYEKNKAAIMQAYKDGRIIG